jgi:tetratricopeptide (TPR) repeat protein
VYATLAIKTQPDSILRASTLVERSKVKTELKDKKGADEDFREAGEIFDRTGEGLEAYEDANLNYNSGNYKMALKSYNRAISFLPSLGNVYYYRGITKEELDDYTGAMDDYSKNIEANASNQSSSYYRRAKIEHYKLKNDDAALDDYNKAIELDPSNAEYYTSRAILLDEYEAVKDLNRAIELDPPNAMNYFTRSLAKCTLEDFEGSVQDINRFIAMAPTGEVLSVADAYSFRGDVKNRIVHFRHNSFDFCNRT